MEQEKKNAQQHREKQGNRKEYAKQGSGSQQKMMSFRLDADLVSWLDAVGNKGRLINKLLHACKSRWEREGHVEQPDRHDPIQPLGDFEE